jgi:hypothetical protein
LLVSTWQETRGKEDKTPLIHRFPGHCSMTNVRKEGKLWQKECQSIMQQ